MVGMICRKEGTSLLLPHLNPDWFIFLVPAYPGCPGKRLLNGCSSSSSSGSKYDVIVRLRVRVSVCMCACTCRCAPSLVKAAD